MGIACADLFIKSARPREVRHGGVDTPAQVLENHVAGLSKGNGLCF